MPREMNLCGAVGRKPSKVISRDKYSYVKRYLFHRVDSDALSYPPHIKSSISTLGGKVWFHFCIQVPKCAPSVSSLMTGYLCFALQNTQCSPKVF